MNIELTVNEARVIGCLMEKSVTTPEQYPLTLNALTSACNQKSSREPVLSLESGEVLRTARQLEANHLLSAKQDIGSRVEKFTQRLCNTPFADFQFSDAEFALICLLLLRGPQTPGELRTRSARLCAFATNDEAEEVLNHLADRDDGPFVAQLPRRAGRRDSEFGHLFSGPISTRTDSVAPTSIPPQSPPSARRAPMSATTPVANDALEGRVAALETEVAALRRALDELARDEP